MPPVLASEPFGCVVLALNEQVDEETLIELARNNPAYRFETTHDGRLIVSPPTGTFASLGEGELYYQLETWNRVHKLGIVLPANAGITLANGAIKAPDATFISHVRMAQQSPNRQKRAFEELVPDAIFEVLSPTDVIVDLQNKCQEYIDTGSGVAVLLNPRDRSVAIYRKGNNPIVVSDAETIVIGTETPGFVLCARAVFDASGKTF